MLIGFSLLFHISFYLSVAVAHRCLDLIHKQWSLSDKLCAESATKNVPNLRYGWIYQVIQYYCYMFGKSLTRALLFMIWSKVQREKICSKSSLKCIILIAEKLSKKNLITKRLRLVTVFESEVTKTILKSKLNISLLIFLHWLGTISPKSVIFR